MEENFKKQAVIDKVPTVVDILDTGGQEEVCLEPSPSYLSPSPPLLAPPAPAPAPPVLFPFSLVAWLLVRRDKGKDSFL